MTDRHAIVTNPDPADETVRIPFSRYKLMFLAAVAFFMSAAAFAKVLQESGGGGDPIADYGLIVLGIGVGGWMLHWSLEKRPALVIDEAGISAIRPDTGIIPWRCVSALGMTKLALVRAALMVGVSEDDATEEELERWRRRYASAFLNPSLTRFRSQTGATKILQIPISFMGVSRKDLQKILEDKVQYEGD